MNGMDSHDSWAVMGNCIGRVETTDHNLICRQNPANIESSNKSHRAKTSRLT